MVRAAWRFCAVGVVVGGLAWTGAADAQQPPPPAQAGGQPGARGGVSDPELIGWLIIDNQAEIEISRIGEQQSSNPEVQQFSRQMIQDHTQMLQTLQGAPGGPPAGGPGQRPDARTGSPIPPEILDRNALLGLYAQLGQRVVDSATQMLQQYRGPQFDREYMQLQVALHMRQLDTLDLFSRHASPQLRSTLQQSTGTVRQHLDHARNILAQVEAGAGSDAAPQGRVGRTGQPPRYSAEYGLPPQQAWGSPPAQQQWGVPGGTVYGGTVSGGRTYGGTVTPYYSGHRGYGSYGYPVQTYGAQGCH